jgi:hypothetical protein
MEPNADHNDVGIMDGTFSSTTAVYNFWKGDDGPNHLDLLSAWDGASWETDEAICRSAQGHCPSDRVSIKPEVYFDASHTELLSSFPQISSSNPSGTNLMSRDWPSPKIRSCP